MGRILSEPKDSMPTLELAPAFHHILVRTEYLRRQRDDQPRNHLYPDGAQICPAQTCSRPPAQSGQARAGHRQVGELASLATHCATADHRQDLDPSASSRVPRLAVLMDLSLIHL